MSTSYAAEVLADSPLVYLHLNEPVPGTGAAADSSGNSHPGTYVGSPVTAAGLVASRYPDAAVDFSGAGQGVSSVYAPFVTNSQRTFEIWGVRDTSTTNDVWFGSDTGAGHTVICRSDAGGGDLNFWSDGDVSPVTWSSVITNGLPYHIAITYDDSTKGAELFLNGASQGTRTLTNKYQANGTYTLGYYGGLNDPFDGRLDEYAIYPSILSPARILAHWNASRLLGPNEDAGSSTSNHPGLWAVEAITK